MLTTTELLLPNIVFHAGMITMFYNLYRVKQHGPGFLQSREGTAAARDWSIVMPQRFCSFCVVQQPVRAHHCARCNCCVARFDHHCPWIDSCVGYTNNHYFLVMVFGAALAHTAFIWQSYTFIAVVFSQSESWFAFFHDWSSLCLFAFVVSVAQGLAEYTLVYVQLLGALNDTTTSEMQHMVQVGVPNPFDRGTATNLKQFFHLLPAHQQMDWRTKQDGPQMGVELAEDV